MEKCSESIGIIFVLFLNNFWVSELVIRSNDLWRYLISLSANPWNFSGNGKRDLVNKLDKLDNFDSGSISSPYNPSTPRIGVGSTPMSTPNESEVESDESNEPEASEDESEKENNEELTSEDEDGSNE